MELVAPYFESACILDVVNGNTSSAVLGVDIVSIEEEATAILQDVANFNGGGGILAPSGVDLTFFNGKGRVGIEGRRGSRNKLHHPHSTHPDSRACVEECIGEVGSSHNARVVEGKGRVRHISSQDNSTQFGAPTDTHLRVFQICEVE
jgi:hypothetical protein